MAQDPFDHAEIALVLSGLPISRSFAARDLYRQGRVEQIVVIPEPPNKIEGEMIGDQVKEELIQRRLVDPALPQWAERILVATGVPKSKLVVLPHPVHGTILEAKAVRAWFHDRLPHRLVVITSKSASRRARVIFRHEFRKDHVQIVAYPTPYDSFEPHQWWAQPRNALTVVTEYEKLLTNLLTLTLHPDS